MRSLDFSLPTLALFALLPSIQAQLVSSLPNCVQTCIDQSQDENCAVTDVACLCRASAGNFLPDLVTCVHGNCDNDLDNNVFLTAFSAACNIAGAPIPAAALRNAENEASSLATQVTTTATVTVGGSSASTTTIPGSYTTATIYGTAESWGGPQTSTLYTSASVSTVTVTTTISGSAITQVYPVTMFSTTTESGPTSTITSISKTSFTQLIPIVITGTNSDGSVYTSATTEPGVISTYTTTDFAGSTVTTTTTYTQQASSSSQGSGSSAQSTSSGVADSGAGDSSSSSSRSRSRTSNQLTTSTIFIPENTRAPASTKTSTAPSEGSTNSSPYLDTNNSGTRESAGNWLGLSMLFAAVYVWV